MFKTQTKRKSKLNIWFVYIFLPETELKTIISESIRILNPVIYYENAQSKVK